MNSAALRVANRVFINTDYKWSELSKCWITKNKTGMKYFRDLAEPVWPPLTASSNGVCLPIKSSPSTLVSAWDKKQNQHLIYFWPLKAYLFLFLPEIRGIRPYPACQPPQPGVELSFRSSSWRRPPPCCQGCPAGS